MNERHHCSCAEPETEAGDATCWGCGGLVRKKEADLLTEARCAYLGLTRAQQAEFWRWIRSGEADKETETVHHG